MTCDDRLCQVAEYGNAGDQTAFEAVTLSDRVAMHAVFRAGGLIVRSYLIRGPQVRKVVRRNVHGNQPGAFAAPDATRAKLSYSVQSSGCSSSVSGFHMRRGRSRMSPP